MQAGQTIPDFDLPTDGEKRLTKSDLLGKWTILYFYPKDNTPGCTTQAVNFSAHMDEIRKLGAQVVGVSKDSPKSHDKFIAKHELKFHLISDENGELCESFGVWVEKNMYGKKYMGIERSTFLIDTSRKILFIWKKVKVPGHAFEVLNKIKEL